MLSSLVDRVFFLVLVLGVGCLFVDAGDADKDDGNLPLAYLQHHVG
jgi:hypothetical protein